MRTSHFHRRTLLGGFGWLVSLNRRTRTAATILGTGGSLLAATLALGACDPLDPVDPGSDSAAANLFDDERESQRSAMAASPIATIQLANGGTVEFIDQGDGGIVIGEKTALNQPLRVRPLLLQSKATPLEVFEALRNDEAPAPQVLVADHDARQAAAGLADAPPRGLQAAPIAFDLNDPGVETYACHAFGGDWVSDWNDAFDGVTDHHPATYKHHLTKQHTFYPGGHVYYGTNSNSATYLGACNGDADVLLPLEIHRRVKHVKYNLYPQPPTVWYTWEPIVSIQLEAYEKYTFYSPIPAFYRGRVLEAGVAIKHLGVGAAYTPTPGLTLGL